MIMRQFWRQSIIIYPFNFSYAKNEALCLKSYVEGNLNEKSM